MHTSPKQFLPITLFAILSGVSVLSATPLIWDADPVTATLQDGGGAWDTVANNWWDGAANVRWNNATPDSAVFGSASGAAGVVTNLVAITVANITFNPALSGSYTLTNSAANPLTLANTTVTNNANAAINAVLAGTGFTKEGGAQLSLRPPANNIYSGPTLVNHGILALNSSTASRVLIPGDLTVNSGATVTNTGSSGPLADTSTVTVNSGGTFSCGSDVIGTLVLAGGNVIQLTAETLTAANVDARSGAVLQNSTSAAKLDGNLIKSTSGTVTLTSKGSTAAGGGLTNTVVNDGALILDYVQNSSKLNDAGTLTVNGGTLVQINGSHSEQLGALTLAGGVITNAGGTAKFTLAAGNYDARAGAVYTVFTGAAGLTKTTPGTLVLAAVHTYSGTTLISDGILQLGDGILSGTVNTSTITNNATLVLDPGSAATFSTTIGGTGTLVKTGGGTANLTQINSYLGSTTLSNGVLTIDSDATLGDGNGILNLSGGTLSSTASRTTTTAPLTNPVNVNGDSAITTSSTSATVDLNLSNDSISGTAGTLTFRNDAPSGTGVFVPRFSGSSFNFTRPIVIANGSFGTTRLDSYNTTGTTQIFSGAISGTGGYRRNANAAGTGGATVFNGNNTYTGPTDVTRGLLQVNGTLGTNVVTIGPTGTLGGNGTINGPVLIQSGGTLATGTSIGQLTISNTLVFQITATNVSELNKALGTNDLIRGLTSVTYNGILVVNNLAGTLAANDTFKLFDAASYSGSFASFSLPPLATGLSWNTSGLTNNGTLTITGTATATPQIGSALLDGHNLILTGGGGTVGANYYVLTSTNAALPLAAWKSIATNQFIAGGNFNFTNLVDPRKPNLFFILQVP